MSVPATSPTPTPAAKAEKATEPGLLDRYLALGTAVRLAIAVGIALVLWLFAEDYIWSAARSIDATCDAMQKSLEEGAERSQLVERSESVKEAIVSIGPIAIPRSEKDGTQELSKSIEAVMKANKLEGGYALDVRAGAKLPPSALSAIAGSNGRIQKVVAELKFDASQEVAARVIEQLENRAEIESLSRVKLSKKEGGDKKVAVQLTVEAWIQVAKTVRGTA